MQKYKVMNPDGDIREVSEDKLNLAAQDDFLPVVSKGKDQRRVSFSNMEKAYADGFQPLHEAESFSQGFKDLSRGVSEGVPGYGLIQKAAAGISAGLEEGLEFLGASYVGKKDFSDRYKKILADDMALDKEAAERSPVLNTTGKLVSAIVAPNPVGKTAIGRIASNAGVAAADAGTRGEEMWDGDAAGNAAMFSGGISGVAEALPYVGKVAKYLTPGTKGTAGLVNKTGALVAGLNPFNKASIDEVRELFTDVAGRRAARGANFPDETIKVAGALDDARQGLKSKTGDAYRSLEQAAMSDNDVQNDLKVASRVWKDIAGAMQTRIDNEDLYSPISNTVLKRVEHIINNGAPDEVNRKLVFAGKAIGDIKDPEIMSSATKWRLLESRRALDDALKAHDFEKLPKYDRALIQELRTSINQGLQKEFAGSDDLRRADEIYSTISTAADEMFNPLTNKSTGKIDPKKLMTHLNDDKVTGKVFQNTNENLNKLMTKYQDELGNIPEVIEAQKQLSKLQELARWNSKLDITDRAAGGPTGQGANAVLQVLGAYSSNGLSLLALPITNPGAYTRLVDELAAMGESETATIISNAAKAMLNKAPQVATRMYALREKDVNGK